MFYCDLKNVIIYYITGRVDLNGNTCWTTLDRTYWTFKGSYGYYVDDVDRYGDYFNNLFYRYTQARCYTNKIAG